MHTAQISIDMSSSASDDSDWTFVEETDSDSRTIDDVSDEDDAPTLRQEIPSFLRVH